MLQFIFYKIMYMSIAGGTIAGLIFLLQLVSKRYFSYQWHYYIWITALALFIIPFSGSLPSDMPNHIPVPAVTASPPAPEPATSNNTLADPKANEEMYASPSLHTRKIPINDLTITFIPLVWLAVLLLLASYKARARIRFSLALQSIGEDAGQSQIEIMQILMRKMQVNQPIRLKCIDGMGTPFIAGIFRPVIFVPQNIADHELSIILPHEIMHHKRHDLLLKLLIDGLSLIHWFNPMIYLLARETNKYCELSCDEKVVQGMGRQEREDYSLTIISLMKRNSLKLSGVVAFCESRNNIKNMKERLDVIMKNKTNKRRVVILSLVLAISLCLAGGVFAAGINGKNDINLVYQTQDLVGLFVGDDFTEALVGQATMLNSQFYTYFNVKLTDGQSQYEIKLNRVSKKFSQSHDLKGLFTITKNKKIIAENETGYLINLPGQGLNDRCRFFIPPLSDLDNSKFVALDIYFQKINQELAKEKTNEFLKFAKDKDTMHFDITSIEKAVVNGDIYNDLPTWDMIEYNPKTQKAYYNISISKVNGYVYYQLLCDTSDIDYKCTDDTIKGHFKLLRNGWVTDSFDATISGLANGAGGYMEIKSDDGKFFMKAKLAPYTDRSNMAPGAPSFGDLHVVEDDK